MTKEDMNLLVKLAKEGNQSALTKLYLQCEKMISNYCRRYKVKYIEQSDLNQYGAYYFMKAIEKFDLNRDLKFTTFLHGQLQQISRDCTYDDFVITRRADYLVRIKNDVDSIMKSVSIDNTLSDSGYTYSDLLVDTNTTPEDNISQSQTSSIIRDEILQVLAGYPEPERDYIIYYHDLYEILGLVTPSEEPAFAIGKSRKDTVRKTFQNRLKYSKKLSRDMIHSL